MSKEQQKMIHRLVDIKQRAADAAEVRHVEAHNQTLLAEAAHKRQLALWNAFLCTTTEGVESADDLAHRDLEFKWLRKNLEEHEQAVMIARLAEAETREAMTSARIELRRYETWLENSREAQRLEAKRREAISDDEVAARKRSASR